MTGSFEVVVLAGRLALIVLFAGSALAKLRAPSEFAEAVEGYRLLPPSLVRPASVAIPLAEAGTVVLLLWSPTLSMGGLAALGLLVTFSAALAANLLRGRSRIDCGCFGSSPTRTIGWGLVWRNVVLMTPAVVCAVGAAVGRERVWLDTVTATGGAIVVIAVFLGIGELASLSIPRPEGLGTEGTTG